MHRNRSGESSGKRPNCLPDGGIGLVDTQYFTLFGMVDVIGNDGVEHGIAQAVEQAVNTKTYGKGNYQRGKTGNEHGCKTQYGGKYQYDRFGWKCFYKKWHAQLHDNTADAKSREEKTHR